jgi:hypothetical protein
VERALARHPSIEQRLDALFELHTAAPTPRLEASAPGAVATPVAAAI